MQLKSWPHTHHGFSTSLITWSAIEISRRIRRRRSRRSVCSTAFCHFYFLLPPPSFSPESCVMKCDLIIFSGGTETTRTDQEGNAKGLGSSTGADEDHVRGSELAVVCLPPQHITFVVYQTLVSWSGTRQTTRLWGSDAERIGSGSISNSSPQWAPQQRSTGWKIRGRGCVWCKLVCCCCFF